MRKSIEMGSNSEDSISFSFIVDNLEKLADRAKNGNHGPHFERLTLNNRILANIENEISNRDNFIQNVSDSELAMYKRGTLFRWSSIKSSIDFFRWSRSSTAEELAAQSYNNAKENSLILAITALRSIIEISGNAALLENDLQEIAKPNDDKVARKEWLNKIDSIIGVRIAGVRVDYYKLMKNGLRGTRKFSYKPGHYSDQTSKDLMNGVDLLDKRIKGARAAYEFFSEFSHPNLASVLTNYERTEMKLKVIDIHGYAAHHQSRHVGASFLEQFGSLIAEGIDIVGECVDELMRIDLTLKSEGEAIAIHAKKEIREIIRLNPDLFDSRELCPCNSGRNIQQCCGKMIKASKFGMWTPAAQLH